MLSGVKQVTIVIFERLDLGVARLGSIDNRLASMDSTLKENSVLLDDIKGILQRIAEK